MTGTGFFFTLENVMYQVISKATGEVMCEHFAYAPLEVEYRDSGHLYFIRNATTGVEWEIPD